MSNFYRKGDSLYAESLPIADIAQRFGTPLYLYSRRGFEDAFISYKNAFASHPTLICYAVKANSNIAILQLLAKQGAGFDIVSVGELERVLKAGGDPKKIVFSGVAKTADEMQRALEVGIHCFNVESVAELARLNQVAISLNTKAAVSLRINPDVDAQTHPYISTGLQENKFGIGIDDALDVYKNAATLPGLNIVGVDCHIGSQLTSTAPFLDALDRVLLLVDQLAECGITIKHLDMGGGLGVRYNDESPPSPQNYADALLPKLKDRDFSLILEPGRSIAANAGVLITQVQFLKQNGDKHFAIVDAGMNDLMRPALYQAWQKIEKVDNSVNGTEACWDIVGPVCETGCFLGKNRDLNLAPDELLVVYSAGAYGFTMASNYNTRARPAEVIVDGDQCHLARARETTADLFRDEFLISEHT